jgi:hypothetical protein
MNKAKVSHEHWMIRLWPVLAIRKFDQVIKNLLGGLTFASGD